MLKEPLDSEIEELFQAYQFIKVFGGSLGDYESRPFKESQWLLHIHETNTIAMNELQEEANRRSAR